MTKINCDADITICVVGLGYVGLPLALAFGRSGLRTFGFDINKKRITELTKGIDSTLEVDSSEIDPKTVIFSSDERVIKKANFIIVTVPTPVDKANQPDLSLVIKATEMVGRNLSKHAIVIYESTVYPGVTEDICGPILERESGLTYRSDFKVGYSPERMNPGDKEHSVDKIVKVVSAMDKESLDIVAAIYGKVCQAGIFKAKNIKTAEAAKVIENTQRDINIALINELSLIFNRLGIHTTDVLEAAGTKWNFLKFYPGLVGGHCIGVDPYYLVHKAEEVGYHPQVIASGRRVNDYMADFAADLTIKGLARAGRNIQGAKVLVLGLTFKENVKDARNSKILNTINKLKEFGVKIYGFDPYLDREDIEKEFNIPSLRNITGKFDAVILATAHHQFEGQENTILDLFEKSPVVVDIKNFYPSLRSKRNVIYYSF